ncbi:MAG: hypothetical protein OXI96_10380 [Acidimicrobiaceae bacterium]|nr:hypothetical protein [Acidimicrobiaceae bacterium]
MGESSVSRVFAVMSGTVTAVFGFIVDDGVVVSVVLCVGVDGLDDGVVVSVVLCVGVDGLDDGVVVSVVLCVGVDGGVSAGDETLVSRG